MWGKLWLKDKTLEKIGDSGELAFVRILCYANACLKNGYFKSHMDNPSSLEMICVEARVSKEQFELLVSHGLVSFDGEIGAYFVSNWDKHQKYERSVGGTHLPAQKPHQTPLKPAQSALKPHTLASLKPKPHDPDVVV